MKRGTLRHPKTLDVAERLDCDPGVVFGILEALVHFTAEFAPRGDIGRWSDARIEAALEVPRLRAQVGPGAIVAALTAAGYLDADPVHRLLVHDWKDHADDGTKKKLARAGHAFAEPTVSGHDQDPCPDMSRHDPDSCPDVSDQPPKACGKARLGSGLGTGSGQAPAVETRRDAGRQFGVRQVPDWDPDGFRRLHKQYPRAAGIESSALEAIPYWDALHPDAAVQAAMQTGLDAWKACKLWRKDDGAFVMAFWKWLKFRRWESPPTAADERDDYARLLDEIDAEVRA